MKVGTVNRDLSIQSAHDLAARISDLVLKLTEIFRVFKANLAILNYLLFDVYLMDVPGVICLNFLSGYHREIVFVIFSTIVAVSFLPVEFVCR